MDHYSPFEEPIELLENEEQLVERSSNLAILLRTSKLQHEVGVAVCQPRQRESCIKGHDNEDTKVFNFFEFQFFDNDQLSTLETVLVQFAPIAKCFIVDEKEATGDAKKLRGLLKSHDVGHIQPVKRKVFSVKDIETDLPRILGKTSLICHQKEMEMDLAVGCVAGLICELEMMSDPDNYGRYNLQLGNLDSALQLDGAAVSALNLFPDSQQLGNENSSLFQVLNRGKTAMGKRLLERWLRLPLTKIEIINQRQELVQAFFDDSCLRSELLEECMRKFPDLDKIAVIFDKKKTSRLTELVAMYDVANGLLLHLINAIENCDSKVVQEYFLTKFQNIFNDLRGYIELVEEVVDLDKRPTLLVNPKHDEELCRIREKWDENTKRISLCHEEAREEIGGDIKCDKDKVRGYVFRLIKKTEESRICKMEDVHICQVLANGVHFTTTKLKKLANRHKEIMAEYESRQSSLIKSAVDVAGSYVPVFEALSKIIAELDVLLGFAHVAAHAGNGYCRPKITACGGDVLLQNSRHPCVELQDDMAFIPNDYTMTRKNSRFQIVTGPNMGGKSTYIRQIGSIAIMAQVGSFVPAETASLPIFDRILARVGAGDAQHRGVSTFMAEMLEAAVILHSATKHSLVIIDELGRGTSTYDGFGLAFAISEYLLKEIQCMCLFATHFHELSSLEKHECNGAVNKHVTAHTENGKITMVYEVRKGPCTQSFGINVAELAHFPDSVIDKAKQKAQELEKFELSMENSNSRDKNETNHSDTKKMKNIFSTLKIFSDLKMNDMTNEEIVKATQQILSCNNDMNPVTLSFVP